MPEQTPSFADTWNGQSMGGDTESNRQINNEVPKKWDSSAVVAEGLKQADYLTFSKLMEVTKDSFRFIFSKQGRKVRLVLCVTALKLAQLACANTGGELNVPNIVDPPQPNPAENVPVLGPALTAIDQQKRNFQLGLQEFANSGAEGVDNTFTSLDMKSMVLSNVNESYFPIDAKDYFALVCPPGFGSCRVRSRDGSVSQFIVDENGKSQWLRGVNTTDGVTIPSGEVAYFAVAGSDTFSTHELLDRADAIYVIGDDPVAGATQDEFTMLYANEE